MTTTAKALIVGTTLALVGVALLQASMPAKVVRLAPVEVTAQRLAPADHVVVLDPVVITATRAEVIAAQAQEAGKLANASVRKGG